MLTAIGRNRKHIALAIIGSWLVISVVAIFQLPEPADLIIPVTAPALMALRELIQSNDKDDEQPKG